jgi:hypothetical protein
MVSDAYPALAAQAYGPLGARDLHRQTLNPGDPAKAGQGGMASISDSKARIKIPFLALLRLWAKLFRRFFIPDTRHPEAKNLNGGKLNKLNQPP